jgi:hypothetical protein
MVPVIPIIGVWLVVRKLFVSNKLVSLELNETVSGKTEESLCGTCVCSLIRKDGNGTEFTFCNYGSKMSPVEFVVIECSGYEDRHVERPAKIAGFIQPGRRLPKVTVIRIPLKTGTR